MKFLKRFLAALSIAVASMLGYQVSLPPSIEDQTSDVKTEAEVTPKSPRQIKVSVSGIVAASEKEIVFIENGIDILNRTLNTECFYFGLQSAKMTETNNMSNDDIFEIFLKNEVNVKIEMFYGSFMQNKVWKTVGIDKGNGTVYMNRYFVQDAETVASLVAHEALGHGLGFSHRQVKQTSVPYTLNTIVETCIKEIKK